MGSSPELHFRVLPTLPSPKRGSELRLREVQRLLHAQLTQELDERPDGECAVLVVLALSSKFELQQLSRSFDAVQCVHFEGLDQADEIQADALSVVRVEEGKDVLLSNRGIRLLGRKLWSVMVVCARSKSIRIKRCLDEALCAAKTNESPRSVVNVFINSSIQSVSTVADWMAERRVFDPLPQWVTEIRNNVVRIPRLAQQVMNHKEQQYLIYLLQMYRIEQVLMRHDMIVQEFKLHAINFCNAQNPGVIDAFEEILPQDFFRRFFGHHKQKSRSDLRQTLQARNADNASSNVEESAALPLMSLDTEMPDLRGRLQARRSDQGQEDYVGQEEEADNLVVTVNNEQSYQPIYDESHEYDPHGHDQGNEYYSENISVVVDDYVGNDYEENNDVGRDDDYHQNAMVDRNDGDAHYERDYDPNEGGGEYYEGRNDFATRSYEQNHGNELDDNFTETYSDTYRGHDFGDNFRENRDFDATHRLANLARGIHRENRNFDEANFRDADSHRGRHANDDFIDYQGNEVRVPTNDEWYWHYDSRSDRYIKVRQRGHRSRSQSPWRRLGSQQPWNPNNDQNINENLGDEYRSHESEMQEVTPINPMVLAPNQGTSWESTPETVEVPRLPPQSAMDVRPVPQPMANQQHLEHQRHQRVQEEHRFRMEQFRRDQELEERRRELEERERRQQEERERERRRKEEEIRERQRKEKEKKEQEKRLQKEEQERKKQQEKEELERQKRHEEEIQRQQKEREELERRKEQEEKERKEREQRLQEEERRRRQEEEEEEQNRPAMPSLPVPSTSSSASKQPKMGGLLNIKPVSSRPSTSSNNLWTSRSAEESAKTVSEIPALDDDDMVMDEIPNPSLASSALPTPTPSGSRPESSNLAASSKDKEVSGVMAKKAIVSNTKSPHEINQSLGNASTLVSQGGAAGPSSGLSTGNQATNLLTPENRTPTKKVTKKRRKRANRAGTQAPSPTRLNPALVGQTNATTAVRTQYSPNVPHTFSATGQSSIRSAPPRSRSPPRPNQVLTNITRISPPRRNPTRSIQSEKVTQISTPRGNQARSRSPHSRTTASSSVLPNTPRPSSSQSLRSTYEPSWLCSPSSSSSSATFPRLVSFFERFLNRRRITDFKATEMIEAWREAGQTESSLRTLHKEVGDNAAELRRRLMAQLLLVPQRPVTKVVTSDLIDATVNFLFEIDTIEETEAAYRSSQKAIDTRNRHQEGADGRQSQIGSDCNRTEKRDESVNTSSSTDSSTMVLSFQSEFSAMAASVPTAMNDSGSPGNQVSNIQQPVIQSHPLQQHEVVPQASYELPAPSQLGSIPNNAPPPLIQPSTSNQTQLNSSSSNLPRPTVQSQMINQPPLANQIPSLISLAPLVSQIPLFNRPPPPIPKPTVPSQSSSQVPSLLGTSARPAVEASAAEVVVLEEPARCKPALPPLEDKIALQSLEPLRQRIVQELQSKPMLATVGNERPMANKIVQILVARGLCLFTLISMIEEDDQERLKQVFSDRRVPNGAQSLVMDACGWIKRNNVYPSTTLSALSPRLATVLLDTYGSAFVGHRLGFGHAEELKALLKTLLADVITFAVHPQGMISIDDLILNGDVGVQTPVLQALYPHLRALSSDAVGHKLIVQALHSLPPRMQCIVADELKDAVSSLVYDQYGSLVLQAASQCLEDIDFLCHAFRYKVDLYARHLYAHSVLLKLIERHGQGKVSRPMLLIMDEAAAAVKVLGTDNYGSRVLRALFGHGRETDKTAVEQYVVDNTMKLLEGKDTFDLLLYVVTQMSNIACDALLANLCAPHWDRRPSPLLTLATHSLGHVVLLQLLDSARGQRKKAVLIRLRTYHNVLDANEHGRKIMQKIAGMSS